MARTPRKTGADVAPVYMHAPATTVPLSYPFKIGDAEYSKVDLNPPTLGDLEVIRAEDIITARSILMPMTGLSPAALSAIRWIDLLKIMEGAEPLLPPDIIQAVAGDPPAPDAPASPTSQATAPPVDSEWAAPDEKPGDIADFLYAKDDLITLGPGA